MFAYGYSDANRLATVTRNSILDATYHYDSDGHRVEKISTVPGIASAHFLYDDADQQGKHPTAKRAWSAGQAGKGHLIAEATTGGTTTTEYIYLGDVPLAMVTDADTVSPRINWLHTDHLGTPQKATDDSAAVVWDATTTPYGELTALTASITQPLRLPGQYADAETGLHQNWWRDYDPSLGRYLQADPIGLAGGASLYGYANANPVLYVDRDGKLPWLPIAAGAVLLWNYYETGNDVVDTAATLLDSCSTTNDKLLALSFLALGTIDPIPGNPLKKALPTGTGIRGRAPGPTTDPATGQEVGRIIGDSRGNNMIEPVGGSTKSFGRNGVDTHTTYPNGSNYQRLNPQGHGKNTTPHGHGHQQGTGPGRKGQGNSIDRLGNPVSPKSREAHWTIR